MKFGKRLQLQIERTLPEWRDKFLSYKILKRRIKLISAECFTGHTFLLTASRGTARLSVQEMEFIRLLNVELEKFNEFFIDKEEDFVIGLQELKERIENAKRNSGLNGKYSSQNEFNEEMVKIRKDLVTFHGEMVLLKNYSSLNYTGLVKILKKHDKHTGGLLRNPFIRKVLHQPFCSLELLSKLVKECENKLQSMFPSNNLGETVDPVFGEAEIYISTRDGQDDVRMLQGANVESIFRSTVAALQTIHDLRKGSSSYTISGSSCSRVDEEALGAVSEEETRVSC
ncbi:hypothetical protein O6H91_03G089100 [Diphasiastrum complanatum]|uniref:Uncharacterized protein n=2 Tax=Diphasiastrum complanatum TaxID=34168 RepID=A0ACC2E8T4_DIPCM|nr:hypothetical protein O6H91_Y405700 [Diphasiastrum complanatum]KAJ7562920.1 hypothetical protein O6H91_03G089100 [Diphasiastrum complanatum]